MEEAGETSEAISERKERVERESKEREERQRKECEEREKCEKSMRYGLNNFRAMVVARVQEVPIVQNEKPSASFPNK